MSVVTFWVESVNRVFKYTTFIILLLLQLSIEINYYPLRFTIICVQRIFIFERLLMVRACQVLESYFIKRSLYEPYISVLTSYFFIFHRRKSIATSAKFHSFHPSSRFDILSAFFEFFLLYYKHSLR